MWRGVALLGREMGMAILGNRVVGLQEAKRSCHMTSRVHSYDSKLLSTPKLGHGFFTTSVALAEKWEQFKCSSMDE